MSEGPVWRIGSIKKINLVNFMNHGKLRLELDPGVNLISGRNGSGKSSILQAIVLGLGGGAKMTHRGTSLGQFIRHDTHKAEIQLWLHNEGEESFHQDVYGDEIILERTITMGKAVSAQQIVKDHAGKVRYRGKEASEETKRLLDHFCIELDNPVSVLQQEEAKVFFSQTDESKLYDFYVRATRIKPMNDFYKKARNELTLAQESIEKKKEVLEDKKQERDKWDRRMNQLKRAEGDDRIKEARAKLCWKRAKEHLDSALENKAREEANDAKEKAWANIKKIQVEVDSLTRQREKLNHENRILLETTEEAKLEEAKAKEDKEKALVEEKECSAKINSLMDEMRMTSSDVRGLENSLREERTKKEQKAKEAEKKKERCTEELKKLTSLESGCKAEIDALGNKREELSAQTHAIENDRRNIKHDVKASESQLHNLEGRISALASQSEKALSRFSDEMRRVIRDIDESRAFLKKPIGPMAKHISLVGEAATDRELSDLFEAELGKGFLNSFIVDNQRDRQELEKIFRIHYLHRKPPTLSVCKIRRQRDDISSGRVVSEHKCVLDFLNFDDDDVFNNCVDQKRVEQTLVLTQDQAKNLFEKIETVPKHASKAITKDFFQFFPPSQTGNYSSYYINRMSGSQNLLIASAKHNAERLQAGKDDIVREIVQLKQRDRELEGKWAELNRKKEATQEEVKSFQVKLMKVRSDYQKVRAEMEMLEAGPNMTTLQEQLAAKKKKMEEVSLLHKEAIQRRKALQEAVKEKARLLEEKSAALRDQQGSGLSDKIDECETSLREKQASMRKFEQEHRRLEREAKETKADLERANNELQQAVAQIKACGLDEDVEIPESKEELAAIMNAKSAVKRKKLAKIEFSEAHIVKEMARTHSDVSALQKQLEELKLSKERTSAMTGARQKTFQLIRNAMVRSLARQFSAEMNTNGLNGRLAVDYKASRLELNVKPRGGANPSEFLPISSLSGGERSKTLVCLILSMWEHQNAPFRCLDEWDVYLDEQGRATIEKMLFEFGKRSPYQYIFISPQGSTLQGAYVIKIGE